MKQKMVIKVSSMVNQKSPNKALQVVAGFPGVESAALAGKDKSEIVVIGDRVDAVNLVKLVRKKFAKTFCCLIRYKKGYAELMTVTPVAVDGKKDDKKEKAPAPIVQTRALASSYGGSTPHYVYEIRDHYPSSCSIL